MDVAENAAGSNGGGSVNQGATCYQNNVKQELFTEAVERYSTCMDRLLSDVFHELQSRTGSTGPILNKLGIDRVYEQRDAAEYYEKILTQTSRDASQIFHGEVTHTTICCNPQCGAKTSTDSHFWHLPLALMDSYSEEYHVENGIRDYFADSHFSGLDQMYCEECDDKVDATVKCEVKHHPEVLVLLLKRFDFDYRYMTYVKNNRSVTVPITLLIPENQTYELYAVVDHVGDLRGGHYAAVIKSDDGRWYNFNDGSVTLLGYQPFQLDPTGRSQSAYLLFYRKQTRVTPNGRQSAPVKYHGLINQGATCYLNSLLQVLFMTRGFREAVHRYIINLRGLLDEVHRHTVITCDIITNLGINTVYEPQEAAEYVDRLYQASQTLRRSTQTRCCKCETGRSTESPLWHLPLTLTDSTSDEYHVEDGMKQFVTDQVSCERCGCKMDVIAKCEVKHHPEVLVLLLKRFDFDHRNMTYVRNNRAVNINRTLQLSENQTYELFAAVEHVGDLRDGHHAVIKSVSDGRWYNFCNNTHVLPFQDNDTERSQTVHILFYRRQKPADTYSQHIREVVTREGLLPVSCDTYNQAPDPETVTQREDVEMDVDNDPLSENGNDPHNHIADGQDGKQEHEELNDTAERNDETQIRHNVQFLMEERAEDQDVQDVDEVKTPHNEDLGPNLRDVICGPAHVRTERDEQTENLHPDVVRQHIDPVCEDNRDVTEEKSTDNEPEPENGNDHNDTEDGRDRKQGHEMRKDEAEEREDGHYAQSRNRSTIKQDSEGAAVDDAHSRKPNNSGVDDSCTELGGNEETIHANKKQKLEDGDEQTDENLPTEHQVSKGADEAIKHTDPVCEDTNNVTEGNSTDNKLERFQPVTCDTYKGPDTATVPQREDIEEDEEELNDTAETVSTGEKEETQIRHNGQTESEEPDALTKETITEEGAEDQDVQGVDEVKTPHNEDLGPNLLDIKCGPAHVRTHRDEQTENLHPDVVRQHIDPVCEDNRDVTEGKSTDNEPVPVNGNDHNDTEDGRDRKQGHEIRKDEAEEREDGHHAQSTERSTIKCDSEGAAVDDAHSRKAHNSGVDDSCTELGGNEETVHANKKQKLEDGDEQTDENLPTEHQVSKGADEVRLMIRQHIDPVCEDTNNVTEGKSTDNKLERFQPVTCDTYKGPHTETVPQREDIEEDEEELNDTAETVSTGEKEETQIRQNGQTEPEEPDALTKETITEEGAEDQDVIGVDEVKTPHNEDLGPNLLDIKCGPAHVRTDGDEQAENLHPDVVRQHIDPVCEDNRDVTEGKSTDNEPLPVNRNDHNDTEDGRDRKQGHEIRKDEAEEREDGHYVQSRKRSTIKRDSEGAAVDDAHSRKAHNSGVDDSCTELGGNEETVHANKKQKLEDGDEQTDENLPTEHQVSKGADEVRLMIRQHIDPVCEDNNDVTEGKSTDNNSEVFHFKGLQPVTCNTYSQRPDTATVTQREDIEEDEEEINDTAETVSTGEREETQIRHNGQTEPEEPEAVTKETITEEGAEDQDVQGVDEVKTPHNEDLGPNLSDVKCGPAHVRTDGDEQTENLHPDVVRQHIDPVFADVTEGKSTDNEPLPENGNDHNDTEDGRDRKQEHEMRKDEAEEREDGHHAQSRERSTIKQDSEGAVVEFCENKEIHFRKQKWEDGGGAGVSSGRSEETETITFSLIKETEATGLEPSGKQNSKRTKWDRFKNALIPQNRKNVQNKDNDCHKQHKSVEGKGSMENNDSDNSAEDLMAGETGDGLDSKSQSEKQRGKKRKCCSSSKRKVGTEMVGDMSHESRKQSSKNRGKWSNIRRLCCFCCCCSE